MRRTPVLPLRSADIFSRGASAYQGYGNDSEQNGPFGVASSNGILK
jgi:hypothetical protein